MTSVCTNTELENRSGALLFLFGCELQVNQRYEPEQMVLYKVDRNGSCEKKDMSRDRSRMRSFGLSSLLCHSIMASSSGNGFLHRPKNHFILESRLVLSHYLLPADIHSHPVYTSNDSHFNNLKNQHSQLQAGK